MWIAGQRGLCTPLLDGSCRTQRLLHVLQGPDAVSGAVARHVRTAKSAEDESPQVWSTDLLQSLVVTCHRALRALPAAAPNLLATVNALAAVSPTSVTVMHCPQGAIRTGCPLGHY